MRILHRTVLVVLVLALASCDSPTDQGGTEPGYSLENAYPPDVAEFIDETTAGRLRFDGIEFGFDSATLTAANKEILDGFAEVFENLPGARYSVEAHTDSRGSAADNLALTQDRAEAVRDYLIAEVGGPGPYITARGFGETVPLEDNATAIGRARNRRVEIVVTYRNEPMTRFVLEAHRLDVTLDCDVNPSPDEEQPGDFQITMSVRVSNRAGFYPIDEIVRHMVLANDGETKDLDLVVDAPILQVPGDIVEVYVGIEEWDGGTSYHFRRSQLFQFEYKPDLGCWGRLTESACGVVDASAIIVRDADVGGTPCEMTFDWSLRLVDVP